MDKPNILIFLSDQHSPNYINAMGNKLIKTPNIDSISKNGLSFINAYTSCPLCVPSRSSFLTSKLPSSTGIFTNDNSLASDELTFLHSLGANGYETVLCGRMHFVGEDQKHGFTKRICKDITIDTWEVGIISKELGCFSGTLAAKGCLNKVGKGVSPVLEYDVAVINKAIKYLQQEHEKPQLLVVGTYAPHFSYVAPKEEYEYYFNNLDDSELNNYNDIQYYTAMNDEMQNCPVEKLRKIRAAYYGMITNLDKQIGKVRKAWNEYNNRNNSKSIFIYMSDHGDQIGQRKLFGKKSFYEDSVRIPLFIEGDNIPKNKKIFDPVSIMDIGPSICEYTNSEIFDYIDGKTLNQRLNNKENIIISEFIAVFNSKSIPGRMVRYKNYKLVTYFGYEDEDTLFDLEKDVNEKYNIKHQNIEIYSKLKSMAIENWDVDKLINDYKQRQYNVKKLEFFGVKTNIKSVARRIVPKEAIVQPIE